MNSSGYSVYLSFLFALVFTFDFVLRFVLYEDYPFHFLRFFLWEVCTLVTVIPGYASLTYGTYFYELDFLRLVLVFRFLLELRHRAEHHNLEATWQILLIFLGLLVYISVFAGVFFVLENSIVFNNGQIENYYLSIYFVVVSITTVGYGDFVPVTTAGRVTVIFMLLLSFALLPYYISLLRENLLIYRVFRGYDAVGHVVLSSNGAYRPFVEEFYRNANRKSHQRMLVVTKEKKLSVSDEDFLRAFATRFYVTRMVGSLTELADLKRANINQAAACFLLADKQALDPELEDYATILKAFAIPNFDQQVPVYVQIIQKEHKQPLIAAGVVNIVCIHELTYTLLAQSCLVPGFSTLMGNLMRSYAPQFTRVGGNSIDESEYIWGLSQEVYFFPLGRHYAGCSFDEVVVELYEDYGMVLLGSGLPLEEDRPSMVFLNPRHHIISPSEIGLAIGHGAPCLRSRNLSETSSRITGAERQVVSSRSSSCSFAGAAMAHSQMLNEWYQSKPSVSPIDNPIEPLLEENYKDKDPLRAAEWLLQPPPPPPPLPSPSPTASTPEQNHRVLVEDAVCHTVHVSGHVIVSGSLPGLSIFVKSLRATLMGSKKTIVLLVKQNPATYHWLPLSKFSNILIVHGNPSYYRDLLRAGAQRADAVIVFPTAEEKANQTNWDAHALMSFRMLREMNVSFHVVSLVEEQNSRFLYVGRSPPERYKREWQMNKFYRSGNVWLSSVFDTLAAQMYHNPYLLRVVEELASGRVILLSLRLHLSSFVGKAYTDIFSHLVQYHDMISLGLLRMTTEDAEPHYFVATNPVQQLILRSSDMVYCLLAKAVKYRNAEDSSTQRNAGLTSLLPLEEQAFSSPAPKHCSREEDSEEVHSSSSSSVLYCNSQTQGLEMHELHS